MPFYKINKFFFIVFLVSHVVFSQKQPSINYSSDNHLPNNTIRSLLIDSERILWIGTDNGVVKKENNVFTYFFEEDGLSMNNTWAILEDADKNMWFGSYGGGLTIYDGTSFKVISDKEGLIHNEITKLFIFENYMCVGTSFGVSLIDLETHKLMSCLPVTEEEFRVSGFFEYKNQLYCTTYTAGIFKITQENNQLIVDNISDYTVVHSMYATKDSIYCSNKEYYTKSSKASFVNSNNSNTLQKKGSSIIWDYIETKDQRMFAAAGGLYSNNGGIYEIVGDQFISRSSDFDLTSNNTLSLAYDEHYEKLYIGTEDAGLFEVSLDNHIVFNEIPTNDVLGFAATNECEATLLTTGIMLNESQKKHFISLEKLKHWQSKYVETTNLPLPKYEDKFFELEYNTKASDITLYDIKTNNNDFWINTSIGLFVIKASGELKRYLPVHTFEFNFTPKGDLIETNPYWGLRVYSDLDSFQYKYYPKLESNTPSYIVNSLKTTDKTYLLSVFKGLFVWKNNEFISYSSNRIWSENKLRHITPLENNLAISSESGDVFILNDEKNFKVLQQIPRSMIKGYTISFLEEYKGYLIIGTEKGLTFYKNGKFIFINEEQGLQQPLLNTQIKENNLIIGSKDGYYTLKLDEFTKAEPIVNSLKLTSVYINNESKNFDYLIEKGNLNLAYNQNTLAIKINTNIHPFPNKLSYQYRLNSNESWSNSNTSSDIYLPYLPSGNFTVEIKVLDDSTGKSYQAQLLQLNITPPYWKSWWFIVLAVLVSGIILYFLYWYQIKQTRQFEEQKGIILKRVEETKMEALLAQMNPHFIFNAMNSIQSYIIQNDIDKATLFLGDFSKLIRNNLDYCTRSRILLEEEIEYLKSYIRVENTRFKNRISSTFDIDANIDLYDVEVPSMLLQPFIENAIIHAFPPIISTPTLQISFKLLDNQVLECKIVDNGIGSEKKDTKRLHKSKGLSIVKERLKLLNYDIDKALTISFSKKGTEVILRL